MHEWLNPDAVSKNNEISYLNRNGDARMAFLKGYSMIDANNCLVSFMDITEFKDVESQLGVAREKQKEPDVIRTAESLAMLY
jgi:hypothetical protein